MHAIRAIKLLAPDRTLIAQRQHTHWVSGNCFSKEKGLVLRSPRTRMTETGPHSLVEHGVWVVRYVVVLHDTEYFYRRSDCNGENDEFCPRHTHIYTFM